MSPNNASLGIQHAMLVVVAMNIAGGRNRLLYRLRYRQGCAGKGDAGHVDLSAGADRTRTGDLGRLSGDAWPDRWRLRRPTIPGRAGTRNGIIDVVPNGLKISAYRRPRYRADVHGIRRDHDLSGGQRRPWPSPSAARRSVSPSDKVFPSATSVAIAGQFAVSVLIIYQWDLGFISTLSHQLSAI
jgi:hypothetical protein